MDVERTRWDKVRRIWEIVGELRGEPGCPWDRKQTPESVQTYLIEEAHEAAAAVRAGDVGEAAEELGDLLFMVFFLVHLYEERGDFPLELVCDLISEKMVRRHPHVFGDLTVESAQEVKENWERIKAGEKAASGKASGGIPRSLPGLMRAYRMLSRLSHREGVRWNDPHASMEAFSKGAAELGESLAVDRSVAPKAIGRLMLELVNLARLQDLRAEDCLHEVLNGLGDNSEGSLENV